MRALTGLLCGACAAPLVDERVVGADLPAAAVYGEPGARLGAAVATDGQSVLASSGQAVQSYSPDGALLWESAPLPAAARRLWLTTDGAHAFVPGHGRYRLSSGSTVLEAPDSGWLARCTDGWVDVPGARAAACGPDGEVLSAVCSSEECVVQLDSAEIAVVGPDASVGFLGGVACWAGVDIAADPQAGMVSCADGAQWTGLDGDHLGAGIAGGWMTGVFNKWTVPPRARMVSVAGDVWAVERAAERSGLSVAVAGSITVIGVPGYAGEHAAEGRLLVVGP